MVACDLIVMAKDFDEVKKSVCSLYSEFYNEGDERKKLGLPVVEMMDRFKENNKWDIQIGFCTFVLKQLYENLAKCFPEANVLVKG